MSTRPRGKLRNLIFVVFLTSFSFSGGAPIHAAEPLEAALDSAIKDASGPYAEAVRAFRERSREKIVGGRPAKEDQFPWQVSLMVSWIADPYYAHFCGGSVLDETWILTAAHCVVGRKPRDVIISAGIVSLSKAGVRRNVQRILVHKDYVSAGQGDDVALIRLYQHLTLGEGIRPIKLMTSEVETQDLVKDAKVTAIGWGTSKEGGTTSLQLNFVEIPYVERNRCNLPVSYNGAINEEMICAGESAGGKDPCQGDSGGPLSLGEIQAGIVSWGEGCARPNKFGVYTRVSNYVGWVDACRMGMAECHTK